jgi:hypothetical protein
VREAIPEDPIVLQVFVEKPELLFISFQATPFFNRTDGVVEDDTGRAMFGFTKADDLVESLFVDVVEEFGDAVELCEHKDASLKARSSPWAQFQSRHYPALFDRSRNRQRP